MTEPARDSMQWVRRGVAIGIVVLGWLFIVLMNHRHITAPVVFVGLGFLAVVATIYNLWRLGAAALAPDDPTAWTAPIGPRGELEKEKRTLLKAIKEAEFDHAMGKLSKVDVDDMIRTYRARVIEVMKELDRLDAGQPDSVRAKIAREVKVRLELGAKKPGKAKKKPAESAEPAESNEAKEATS